MKKRTFTLSLSLLCFGILISQEARVDEIENPCVSVSIDTKKLDAMLMDDVDFTPLFGKKEIVLELGVIHERGSISKDDLKDDFLDNGVLRFLDEYTFTVPIDGTYRISSTGFTESNTTAFIHLYSAPPSRNSGPVMDRPDFIGYQSIFDNGKVTSTQVDFNLVAGTYYLDFVAGEEETFIDFYEVAVVLQGIPETTFKEKKMDIAPFKLLTTNNAGYRSSCEATILMHAN